MTVETPPGFRVTVSDVREAGNCSTGIRDWFIDHGLDFRDFVKNGIDAQEFMSHGDAMAEMVVVRKLAKVEDNG